MLRTKNGVNLTFDNNTIVIGEEKPPLLSLPDGETLTEVNLDGYYIISKDKVKNVVEENGVIKSIELK